VIEAAYQLEDKVGLTLGPVIVNACLPDEPWLAVDPATAAAEAGVTLADDQVAALAAAAHFRSSRFRLQQQQRRRLATELPLHQLLAPFVFSDTIGPTQIETIAVDLARAVTAYGAEPRSAESPEAGHPEAGHPETGNPETGNPEAGHPEAGNPEAGP
jgi:hypothetical protein